jgi:hypothetical protein
MQPAAVSLRETDDAVFVGRMNMPLIPEEEPFQAWLREGVKKLPSDYDTPLTQIRGRDKS